MKFSFVALVCLCFLASPLAADNYLILPFFNLSNEANLQWIGESLAETIRDTVAAEGFIALDRDKREEGYRRLSLKASSQITKASILRLGEVLDADQVIYGTFDYKDPLNPSDPKIKGTVRIVAQVVNLRKAHQGPEFSEVGSLEDLARLQNHLSWQMLRYVSRKTAPSEDDFRSRRPVIRVDAMENYIRGLLATVPDQKQKLLLQAVRIDPRLVQANFQLGKLFLRRKQWRSAAENLAKLQATDSHYREALFDLGLCRYRLGEYAEAVEAFRTVAEQVPLNEVWNNLGAAQLRLNQPEAISNLQKALEGDPNDADYEFNVGYALLRSGDHAAAAERFRAVLRRRPGDQEATTLLGRALRGSAPAAAGRGGNPAQSASQIEGLERVKDSFEESAWLQLKAVLETKRP